MDVDTNLRCHVQKIPFVPIRLARPRILHGPKHVFCIRTERMTTSSLVPFRSFLCFLVGVKTRPHHVYNNVRTVLYGKVLAEHNLFI